MAYGYTGKILVADLTAGTVTVDEHDDAWYRKYMGGAALAMDYILRERATKGRSARAGKRPRLRRRPPDRHRHLRPEPHERQLQEPPVRPDRRCPGRRVLPRRAEDGRLRRRRHQGEVARRRSTSGSRMATYELRDASAYWGMQTGRVRRRHPGRTGRQEAADDDHRPRRREPRQVRLPDHLHLPRPRPHRHRRRDGQQEPEVDRRARHGQGRRQGSGRPEEADAVGRQERARQRGHGRPAEVRHRRDRPGAAVGRRPADAQLGQRRLRRRRSRSPARRCTRRSPSRTTPATPAPCAASAW